jgi:hypothetical protein
MVRVSRGCQPCVDAHLQVRIALLLPVWPAGESKKALGRCRAVEGKWLVISVLCDRSTPLLLPRLCKTRTPPALVRLPLHTTIVSLFP